MLSPRPVDAAPSRGPVLTSSAARILETEVARLRALRDAEPAARRDEALLQLEAVLRHAEVVDHDPAGGEPAGIGSRVTVEDVASGRTHEYVLVVWHDGEPGTVSAASPVGQAILGRGVGDEATVSLPGGRSRQLRIVALDQPLVRPG
ncbi:MAG TPA: GreA/GreB family elongation factor [Capillimicrobium sp.]|nr:GreA/GreB family elongation factor [Capillimicrobium sp.]